MNLKLHGIFFLIIIPFFLIYRFAQFFISPLLKGDSMKREIQAVESGEDFIIKVDIHRVWIIIVQKCAPCIILTADKRPTVSRLLAGDFHKRQ